MPPNTWIPHVEASKHEAGAAFVVLDDHRRGDWTPYVFRTTDFGRSWTSLATDEIDGYVHVLEQDPVDPDLLFVGTEFGLFVSRDGGRSWFRWTHGLPNAPVRALVVQERESDLVIATFGRAAYVIDDIGALRATNAGEPGEALHLYPVPATIQHRVRQTNEARFPGSEEFRGAVEPYGAALTFWAWGEGLPHPDAEVERGRAKDAPDERAVDDDAGAEDEDYGPPTKVTIELQDASGATIRTLEHEARLGLNRVRWDLRRKAWDRVGGGDDEEEEESGGDRPGDDVLPGEYRAVLTFGDATASGRVRVLADPRSSVTLDERRAKQGALARAGAVSEAVAAAVRRIEAARADVDVVAALVKRAKKDADEARKEELDALAKEGDALKEALKAADERLRGPRDEKGIRRNADTVLARLGEARWGLGSSWDAPTAAQLAALALAERTLTEASAEVERVLGEELEAFRERFEASGLRLLDPRSGGGD